MLPDTTYAPATAHWEAGLWQADTGDRAFVLDASGRPVSAAVSFGQLSIESLPGPYPNPLAVDFGGELQLKGYSLPSRTLASGQPFELTVHWEQTAPLSHPYLLFMHVVAADGSIWANNSFPVSGAEQTVQPALAPDTPPGNYSLEIGVFYDAGNGPVRLKMLAEDGHELDDHLRLTGVRVAHP